MSATRHPPHLVDYLLLISLAMVFGLSFTLTRIAVLEIPPLSIATGRLLLAFLIFYPIMRFYRQRLPPWGGVWLAVLASSFFGNALPFTLVSWGQIQVEAGLTAIFMAVMPLATILLAHAFTNDEKMTRWKFVGVLLGLLGVVVLMGASVLDSLGDELLSQGAILLSAVSYAINALITRKLTHLPRWSIMASLMLVSSIMLLPFSLWLNTPWQSSPSWAALGSLLGLAVGPTAIGTMMILVIISRQGASFLSQINFMVPVFGMLAGVLLLGERLPANAYFALMFILAGIAISRVRVR